MQARQKLCPQGVDTGLLNTSRQMEHVNWSSDRKAGTDDMLQLDHGQEEKERDIDVDKFKMISLYFIHFSVFCTSISQTEMGTEKEGNRRENKGLRNDVRCWHLLSQLKKTHCDRF